MRPTTPLHGNCVTIWIYGRRKTRFNFKSLPFPFPEGEENSRTRHNLSLASMSFPGLSKSRLLSSLQCPKRLWLEVNRRELSEYSRRMSSVSQSGTTLAKSLGRSSQTVS